jgi:hypothetical protein
MDIRAEGGRWSIIKRIFEALGIEGFIRRDLMWGIGLFYSWARIQIVSGFIANYLLLIYEKRSRHIIVIGAQTLISFIWLVFLPFQDHPYRALLTFGIAELCIMMGWLLTYFARTKLVNCKKAIYDSR